jgi:hypothetical protein
MDFFYQQPLKLYLSAALSVISLISMVLCVRRFIKAYQDPAEYSSANWIIKGIRSLLISLAAAAWAAGLFWNQRWLFVISLIIICQEIWEGAVLSSILRKGEKIEKGEKAFPHLE